MDPGEFTIRELAKKTIALANSKPELIQASLLSDNPKQRQPEISKAREHLKMEPKVDLDECLKRTIDCFRSRIPELASTN